MINQFEQRTKDIPFFQKMLAGCVLVTTLISFVSGGISYFIASDIIYTKTIAQTEETINQLSENYDSYMEIINNRVDYIAYNPTVQEELINGEAGAEDNGYYSGTRSVKRLLVQMFKSNQMEDIMIYGENGKTYFCSIRGNEEHELINEEKLKDAAIKNVGAVTYVNDIPDSGCLQIVKQIKNNLSMESLGVLRTGIRVSALERIKKNVNFASSGTILLLDSDNNIIIGEESELTEQADELFTQWNGSFQHKIDSQQYQIVYTVSDYTGFKAIGILPSKEIDLAIIPLQLATMIALAVGVVLSITLSVFMSRFMGRPIKKTVQALKEVSKGDFSVRLQADRKDEFGEINKEFNHTIEQMEGLLNEIALSRVLNKEMEFKALQAQINPHFLYNTLDTINWMARKENQEDICEMISAVSNLLRLSISNKESMFTVEKELYYVKDYLYIQQTRYRSRFEVFFLIGKDIKMQKIPKLTIQPIVENAIVHSVEVSKEKTIMTISAQRSEDEIHIKIEDTGIGMSKEVLESLLKPQKGKVDINMAHTGLGIYAVNQRLQYMFGEKYGLTIQSEEGVGTCITISIPYQIEAFVKREEKDGTARDDS